MDAGQRTKLAGLAGLGLLLAGALALVLVFSFGGAPGQKASAADATLNFNIS